MIRSMPELKASQVFTPGKNTTLTYVEREHNVAAEDLRKHIRRGGWIVPIVGPTKMGKTVLAKREAPAGSLFIPGQSIQDLSVFWKRFAVHLGISGTIVSSRTVDSSGSLSSGGRVGVGAASFDLSKEGVEREGYSSSLTVDVDPEAAVIDEVVKRIADGHLVTVVIDDFHFVPRGVRGFLVQALKNLSYEGVTIIVITLPHRRAEISDLISDMTGRTAAVEVNPWSKSDLAEIASLGFDQLNLDDGMSIGVALAEASYGSPQIMQHLCLELVETVNGTLVGRDERKSLESPEDWTRFHQIVRDEGSLKWVQRLVGGPAIRGRERTQHELLDGRTLDGYQVIFAALQTMGPPLIVGKMQLAEAVNKVLKTNSAAKMAVGQKLSHMSSLAARALEAQLREVESEDVSANEILAEGDGDSTARSPQPVIEYASDLEELHIIEPYLAYTIRWHLDEVIGGSGF